MNGRGRTCWGSHGASKSSIYRFEWAHTYFFSSVERIRERNGRPRPNFVILYHELGSMSDEYDTIPAEALKEVAYLSRSANRVEILQTLTRGSHTRRDLTELTGASRTTLSSSEPVWPGCLPPESSRTDMLLSPSSTAIHWSTSRPHDRGFRRPPSRTRSSRAAARPSRTCSLATVTPLSTPAASRSIPGPMSSSTMTASNSLDPGTSGRCTVPPVRCSS